MNKKPIICVGIVAYGGLDGQVAEDYMRLMFHLGRRCPEYDFQLAIKSKSEQFRARNNIVKAALQFRADYIWMLDDDHIIDIGGAGHATDAYDLPIKLVKHLEDNPKIGVVGALYQQRDLRGFPVIMQELEDGNPYFLTQSEVTHKMQKLAVTGGGCMMIRASVFDKIDEPWFSPEHDYGTDIQLCKQIRKAGFEVWCDTSLEIGHLQSEKTMVTTAVVRQRLADGGFRPIDRYRNDAQEYLHMDMDQIHKLSEKYYPAMSEMKQYDNLKDYYASRGPSQLARQVIFHHVPSIIKQMELFHSMIDTSRPASGADYGCGSAPVGFELALLGHKMDFIDIDGSASYEFTKWRAKKHGIDCGWELKGPYDYVLMMDSIEHIDNWKEVLGEVVLSLRPDGALITNYFNNADFDNLEHVSMDHDAVREFLNECGLVATNDLVWIKQDIEKEEAA